MGVSDDRMFKAVESFLKRQKLFYGISEEQYCDKFAIKSGAQTVYVSVFNSGKIVIGGKDSPLKTLLNEMKASVEAGEALPGQMLPFEIDRFPELLAEKVTECDPIIIRFVEETILCVKNNAMLAAAFMLGASSEKAINILIDTYANAITDETNKQKFLSRTNNRTISQKYEEFCRSYAGCKSRPADPILSQDIDTILGSMFQFCRITRNEIGHPQIVPDLDRGVILANLSHFVTYIERIYALASYFDSNGVRL